MKFPIVGVDPGGQSTGIVARYGDTLVCQSLVREAACANGLTYRQAVMDEVEEAVIRARDACGFVEPIVALERINPPNPHMGMISVKGSLDTAAVIGWVQERAAARGWRLVMVPPGGHGSHLLAAYPRRLVGPREKTGTGKLRHVRSAWDIAHLGGQLAIRDPSAVASPSVESPPMTDTPDPAEPAEPAPARVTPDDVARANKRVKIARAALTKYLGDKVRACNAAGFSAKEIVDGTAGDEESKLSRQRVYQMLKGEETE